VARGVSADEQELIASGPAAPPREDEQPVPFSAVRAGSPRSFWRFGESAASVKGSRPMDGKEEGK